MKKYRCLLLSGLILGLLACQFVTQPFLQDEPVCQKDNGQAEFIRFNSPYIDQKIIIDGEISTQREWDSAFCMDFQLYEWGDIQSPHMFPARWWVQNDGEFIYYLVRVVKEPRLRGVAADYFWPKYTGTWKFSDGAFLGVDGVGQDVANWDESNFYDDDELDPPGSMDIETALHDDNVFYWFEIKKLLNSGDRYDWAVKPGQVIGYAPTDSYLFALVMEDIVYLRNLQMTLGMP